ncbi:MAG: hypothetical protein WAK95_08105 [Desulfobacterales bacterium]
MEQVIWRGALRQKSSQPADKIRESILGGRTDYTLFSDIFWMVGKFSQRWYLPDLYLEELARRRHFGLISARYERMARD